MRSLLPAGVHRDHHDALAAPAAALAAAARSRPPQGLGEEAEGAGGGASERHGHPPRCGCRRRLPLRRLGLKAAAVAEVVAPAPALLGRGAGGIWGAGEKAADDEPPSRSPSASASVAGASPSGRDERRHGRRGGRRRCAAVFDVEVADAHATRAVAVPAADSRSPRPSSTCPSRLPSRAASSCQRGATELAFPAALPAAGGGGLRRPCSDRARPAPRTYEATAASHVHCGGGFLDAARCPCSASDPAPPPSACAAAPCARFALPALRRPRRRSVPVSAEPHVVEGRRLPPAAGAVGAARRLKRSARRAAAQNGHALGEPQATAGWQTRGCPPGASRRCEVPAFRGRRGHQGVARADALGNGSSNVSSSPPPPPPPPSPSPAAAAAAQTQSQRGGHPPPRPLPSTSFGLVRCLRR